MECLVCGNNHMENGICPDCGFETPMLAGDGNQEEYQNVIKRWAANHQARLRGKISVSLKVLSYRRNSDQLLETAKEEKVPLAGTQKTEPGKICWLEREFARLEEGEDLLLTLFIQNSGSERERQVKLKAPAWGPVLWKIGYKEEERLHFRLVLGAADGSGRTLETESISMMI